MPRKQLFLSAAIIACSAMSLPPNTARAQQAEVGPMHYLPPIALYNTSLPQAAPCPVRNLVCN